MKGEQEFRHSAGVAVAATTFQLHERLHAILNVHQQMLADGIPIRMSIRGTEHTSPACETPGRQFTPGFEIRIQVNRLKWHRVTCVYLHTILTTPPHLRSIK